MNHISCLSYWFPKLVEAGIRVPETQIIKTDANLIHLCDGKTDIPGLSDLEASIKLAIREVSGSDNGPAFIRTGQGSGKHDWQNCCYYDGNRPIIDHIGNLVKWSTKVDFLGLPTNVWVVREYLPVKPVAILDRYGHMPLVREMRCFVAEGEVVCMHPYWPPGAIEDGLMDSSPAKLQSITEQLVFNESQLAEVQSLARDVAKVFNRDEHHEWSVDILETDRGLYVTDMAVARQSYHDPHCPKLSQFE